MLLCSASQLFLFNMLSTPHMPFVVSSNCSLTATMVHCHISTELKELALSMSLQGLHDSEIHEYTGINVWSIKSVTIQVRIRGDVVLVTHR